MIETIIANTKNTIANFMDCDAIEVKVEGPTIKVLSGLITMFCYNFMSGSIIEGQMHKVGFTPWRLDALRDLLLAGM